MKHILTRNLYLKRFNMKSTAIEQRWNYFSLNFCNFKRFVEIVWHN